MDLHKALENVKFDTRMREWNVKQGTINKDDVEKNLKTIKDSAGDCEEVTLEDKGDFEG